MAAAARLPHAHPHRSSPRAAAETTAVVAAAPAEGLLLSQRSCRGEGGSGRSGGRGGNSSKGGSSGSGVRGREGGSGSDRHVNICASIALRATEVSTTPAPTASAERGTAATHSTTGSHEEPLRRWRSASATGTSSSTGPHGGGGDGRGDSRGLGGAPAGPTHSDTATAVTAVAATPVDETAVTD